MAIVSQPDFMPSAFAANGDRNTIPETNDGTEGLASMELGFPPITEKTLLNGGLPPVRDDFNGIFNWITRFLMYQQAGGVFAYDESIDYQPPAMVWGEGDLYKCVKRNGPNTAYGIQPLTDTAYWELVGKNIAVSETDGKYTIYENSVEVASFYGAINILERSKAYAAGDIAFSSLLPSWAYLRCTAGGTTGESAPEDLSSVEYGDSVTDGEATFTVCKVGVASQLGTETVGSGTKPIYLNGGKATASGSTVGSNSKPVYLNNGEITAVSALDATILSGTASINTTGNAAKLGTATVGSGTKPIYLSAGSPVASSSTVGSSTTPVYLNAGTLTACSRALITSDISASSLGTNGYIKFSNGLIVQWGRNTVNTTISFPVSFSSACYSVVWQIHSQINWYDGRTSTSYSTSSFKVTSRNSSDSYTLHWVAFGK